MCQPKPRQHFPLNRCLCGSVLQYNFDTVNTRDIYLLLQGSESFGLPARYLIPWLGLAFIGSGLSARGAGSCGGALLVPSEVCEVHHPHQQMALEESVSKELCWLWMWQKSQCRNLSSNITLQMFSFPHHQFRPSRKASLIIAHP